jgi:hypothetical protein
MFSEPLEGGLDQNGAKRVLFGVGNGIKTICSSTAVGVSNSVARLSGTWFMGVRNLSGRQISESNLENPRTIQEGLFRGGMQLGLEIGKGATGLITVPMKRVR